MEPQELGPLVLRYMKVQGAMANGTQQSVPGREDEMHGAGLRCPFGQAPHCCLDLVTSTRLLPTVLYN
jgi:hypothetical protein